MKYQSEKEAHLMRLLPFIIKAKTNNTELEIYFRFFREFSEEDANHTVLHFAKTLRPEVCEIEKLK